MKAEGGRRFYLVVGFLWLFAALAVFFEDVAGLWMAVPCLALAVVYFVIAMMSTRPAE
jgi:hypothetical protein